MGLGRVLIGQRCFKISHGAGMPGYANIGYFNVFCGGPGKELCRKNIPDRQGFGGPSLFQPCRSQIRHAPIHPIQNDSVGFVQNGQDDSS